MTTVRLGRLLATPGALSTLIPEAARTATTVLLPEES